MLNDHWIKIPITQDIKDQAKDFASKELEKDKNNPLFTRGYFHQARI